MVYPAGKCQTAGCEVTDSKFDIGIIGSGIAGGALAAALEIAACGCCSWIVAMAHWTLGGSHTAGRATAFGPLGAWIGCRLRVPSDALERDGLTPTGSILLRYRFPMNRAHPCFPFP